MTHQPVRVAVFTDNDFAKVNGVSSAGSLLVSDRGGPRGGWRTSPVLHRISAVIYPPPSISFVSAGPAERVQMQHRLHFV